MTVIDNDDLKKVLYSEFENKLSTIHKLISIELFAFAGLAAWGGTLLIWILFKDTILGWREGYFWSFMQDYPINIYKQLFIVLFAGWMGTDFPMMKLLEKAYRKKYQDLWQDDFNENSLEYAGHQLKKVKLGSVYRLFSCIIVTLSVISIFLTWQLLIN
jgi:hypothetical protein